MSLNWLSKVFRWFIGGLFTFFLGWLGIELKKSKKLDETIERQKIVIEEQNKKIEFQRVSQEAIVETAIEMEKIEREQEMVEQKIEDAWHIDVNNSIDNEEISKVITDNLNWKEYASTVYHELEIEDILDILEKEGVYNG